MIHPRRRSAIAALILAAGLSACGDDGPTAPPEPTYHSVAGSYAGTMVGTHPDDWTLEMDFILSIRQTQGTLTGSYRVEGTLTDDLDGSTYAISGIGDLDGTIGSGDFPSVSFDIIPTLCPNLAETWSGTYDQTTRVLNVRGTVNVFDVDSCEDLLLFTGPLSLAQ